MTDKGPGWRVETYSHCHWVVLGKFVLRIGRPLGPHNFKYAWRPFIKFFRCYK